MRRKRTLIIIAVVVLSLGLLGYFMSRGEELAQQPAETETSEETSTEPGAEQPLDPEKVALVDNFGAATPSLQKALINDYFNNAKVICDAYNTQQPDFKRKTSVMLVAKVVRDEFATINFCGVGAPTVMANLSGVWTVIGSLSGPPPCDFVDSYRISKELIPFCFIDETQLEVQYP